jgi:hypothetical protein
LVFVTVKLSATTDEAATILTIKVMRIRMDRAEDFITASGKGWLGADSKLPGIKPSSPARRDAGSREIIPPRTALSVFDSN